MPRATADVEWDHGKSPSDLQRKLQDFVDVLNDELERAVEDLALLVEREAKQNAPVDTGTLRASIESIVETVGEGAIKAYIGTNVSYAPEIEFGRGPVTADGQALRFTVDGEVVFAKSVGPAEAQPFLGPALDAVAPQVEDRLQVAIDNAVRRAG